MTMTHPEANDAAASALVEKLSPRHRDVLGLIAKGLTNHEVGDALGISSETVRTHVGAIIARLDVTNRTEAAAAYVAWEAGAGRVAEVLERPAIVVLPVLALDGSERATAIAAGITRDLTTLFSRWCCFPVIAHASARDARALGDTSQEIGRRLGARFLVDGALRSSPSSFRVTVSVIDAESGYAVWTDGHDFSRDGLFEAQDAVCQAIVAAAYPRLVATVHGTLAARRHPRDMDAWAVAHAALTDQEAREREANARAQAGFFVALRREPGLVLAHFGLGLVSYDAILNQWGPTKTACEQLIACAERCVELAPQMAEGHYLAARHCQARGQPGRAEQPLREAIGHNPSFAAAHALLGQVLLLTGRTDEGLTRVQHACRLGPRSYVAGLAVAHFVRSEYAEGLAAARRAIANNPRYPFAHAMAAACAWLGDDAEGSRAHVGTLEALAPGFDPTRFLRTFGAEVDAVSRLVSALEAAGAKRSGEGLRRSA